MFWDNNKNRNKRKLEDTGERFVPWELDKHMLAEHYHRYYSILELVEGKTVLDAACGSGYGSALIASKAENVVGVDISSEAIDFATNYYKQIANVQFCQGAIESLPFPNAYFDVIVSFETIEHVNEEMQNSFLKEIKRCLKNDGILVISTPNKRVYSDMPKYNNEFHVKEFYFEEFDSFLHSEFPYVNHYLQGEKNISGEMIYPVTDTDTRIRLLNYAGCSIDKGRYIVSLCSNKQIDPKHYEISSLFSYVYVPHLFIYSDGLYTDKKIISPEYYLQDSVCKAKFDLSNIKIEGKLRLDPVESVCCSIELSSINTDVINYQIAPVNAIQQDGNNYVFFTDDPMIEIIGDFSEASFIEIEYSLHILDSKDIFQLANERIKDNLQLLDDYKNKIEHQQNAINNYEQLILEKNGSIENLKSEIKSIKSTCGYKILEKLYRVKNFVCR